jgi:hypothetical protein
MGKWGQLALNQYMSYLFLLGWILGQDCSRITMDFLAQRVWVFGGKVGTF